MFCSVLFCSVLFHNYPFYPPYHNSLTLPPPPGRFLESSNNKQLTAGVDLAHYGGDASHAARSQEEAGSDTGKENGSGGGGRRNFTFFCFINIIIHEYHMYHQSTISFVFFSFVFFSNSLRCREPALYIT